MRGDQWSNALMGRKGTVEHGATPTETAGTASAVARAVLVYPIVLAALFILLVAGGVSGSSVAILSDMAHDPGLLYGSPQSIRSDEWRVSTPIFIGQLNSGGGGARLSGVGEHDLSVLGITPTTDWSIVFRPANVASMVLAPESALAWNWWLPMFLSALAFYGLALLCGVGLGLSLSVSMLVSFSPLVEWWHAISITGPLGFGSAACFSILMAIRAKSRRRAFLWSVTGVYCMIAFSLVLYPPFQIPTLLALIPITVAMIAADIGDRRYTKIHAFVFMGIIALTAGIVVAAFILAHRDTISAIQGTVYPGARQSAGGGGSLTQLLSANFSPLLAHGPPFFGDTNLSEIAAPYLLAAESLMVLLLAGWRRTDALTRNAAVAAGCSLALGLAWHQLPVPSVVGRIFLLNIVPPQRVLPLIGIAGPFLLAILAHSQIPRLSQRRRIVVGVGVALTTFGLAMIEALKIKSLLPPFPLPALVAVAILGAAAIATLAAAPGMWGAAAIATLVVIGFLSVNPLYRGVAPLENSHMAEAVRQEGTNATWVNYGDPDLEAFLAASGASSLSGVNFYPNADAWIQLLGGNRDESVWNRFAHTYWVPGSDRADVRQVQEDVVEVRVSPCAPQLTSFGVTRVLARAGTFGAIETCLHQIATTSWHGSRFVIYSRSQ